MSASLVSAYAAVAAVVFGVVNVALAAHLVRRQESHKQAWQHLPAVIEAFGDACFRFMREVWEIDWDVLPPDSRGPILVGSRIQLSLVLRGSSPSGYRAWSPGAGAKEH